MAFKTDDIHAHLKRIGLMHASVTDYGKLGIPSDDDPMVGKVPHMVSLKREGQATFTLERVNEHVHNSLKRGLKWRAANEVDK